ncbi:MAG: hypothetical protein R2827_11315 [Bdellovibrionales bacterium]
MWTGGPFVVEVPQGQTDQLKVKYKSGDRDRVNRIEFNPILDKQAVDKFNFYFDYANGKDELLMLNYVNVEVAKEETCDIEVDLYWGERFAGAKEFDYKPIKLTQRIAIKRGFQYRFWWKLTKLEGCGKVDIEFEMSSL